MERAGQEPPTRAQPLLFDHSQLMPSSCSSVYQVRPPCRQVPMLEVWMSFTAGTELLSWYQAANRRVNTNITSPPHTSRQHRSAEQQHRQRCRCSRSIFTRLKQITFKARQCQSLPRARSARHSAWAAFVTTHDDN